jgi:predicted MFS family arabinose efflux permease
MLAGSVVLIALFVVVELRSRDPMLELGLFRVPAFTGANIVAFTLSSSIFAMFLYITLYVQDVLGYSPLQAGLRFLPITLLSFVVAPVAGRMSVRVPVRLLLGTGLALIAAGLWAMTAVGPHSGWMTLIPGFALCGIGIGLVNPPLASAAIGVVPPQRSGMASGINSTFRQVGIATGIAGLGAIFQHGVTHTTSAHLAASGHARAIVAAAHGHLATLLQSGEVAHLAAVLPPQLRTALLSSYRVGFTTAFGDILLFGGAIALTGSVLAFALVRSRDFHTAEDVAAQTPPQAEAGAIAG